MKHFLSQRQKAEISKQIAMGHAEMGASEAWKEYMLDMIWDACCIHPEITTDEVWIREREMPEPKPHHHENRALGPQMTKAVKLGYIVKTERFRKSTDGARRHAAPLQIWRSLLYRRS
jgi:hypothetical protein